MPLFPNVEVRTEARERETVLPQNRIVTLPGGYITPIGEPVTEVEVRELTGRDEELIAKSTSAAKTLQTVLERGVIRVDVAPQMASTFGTVANTTMWRQRRNKDSRVLAYTGANAGSVFTFPGST